MPFAALVLAACLLMTRLSRRLSLRHAGGGRRGVRRQDHSRHRAPVASAWRSARSSPSPRSPGNEAIWLALTFAIIEWSNVRQAYARLSDRVGAWGINVIPVALVAILTFAPWAFREWVVFGSPFPGQVLTNALSLDGRDIFAWRDQPTLARYLAAGPAKLLELRWTGTVHNLTQVLLLLGVPLSIVGLIGLPAIAGWRRSVARSGESAGSSVESTVPVVDPLRPSSSSRSSRSWSRR